MDGRLMGDWEGVSVRYLWVEDSVDAVEESKIMFCYKTAVRLRFAVFLAKTPRSSVEIPDKVPKRTKRLFCVLLSSHELSDK
jgi:hypothetical protein